MSMGLFIMIQYDQVHIEVAVHFQSQIS